MADQVEASNGVSKAVDVADRDAADRAAFLSGDWRDEKGSDEKAKPGKVAAKSPPVEKSDDDELEAGADDDIELDDDIDDEELEDSSESEDDESSEDEKSDPDKAKRLDAVRRREQRSREQLASERKAFERDRDAFVAEWKPRVEAAERFDALKAKGVNAYTILDLARELGLPEDDYEDAGRNLFAHSKKGKEDPKNAEAMARSRRERERDERLASVEKELRESKEQAKQSREAEEQARAANAYLDGVAKGATEGTLAAHYLKEQPKKTRITLGKITEKLIDRDGELPSAKKVLATYERIRAKELRAMGVDPTTITKAAPAKGTTTTAAAKKGDKTTAKPNDNERPLTKADFIRASNSKSYD